MEKIVAASVEALFFELGAPGAPPGLVDVEGVEPFELHGSPGTLIWRTPGRECQLERLFGGGATWISFQAPGDPFAGEPGEPFIEFGPDRDTARTVIRRYSDGLSGDGNEFRLRKIGDEWFVVDVRLRFLS